MPIGMDEYETMPERIERLIRERDEWKAMYTRMKEKWLDACEKIPASQSTSTGESK